MGVTFIRKSMLVARTTPKQPIKIPIKPATAPEPPPSLPEPSYDDLVAVGIIPPYAPHPALKPVNRPHFKNGVKVRLVAEDGAWRYICKTGDVGTVLNILQSLNGETDDMYKVQMGDVTAYLFYSELEAV